jgi:hypothetical protein
MSRERLAFLVYHGVMHVTDAAFDVPPEPLFPTGVSPFRQKGMVYLGNQEFYAERIPGGMAAVVRSLPNDRQRSFFEQRFQASEWYDALPNAYLQQAAARLRGVMFIEHGRQVGAWHARARMTGIYRAMLKVVSNESVALWIPRLSSVYYDFGRLDTRVVGARRVSIVRSGIPAALVRLQSAVMIGMGEETLALSGAREVRAVLNDVTPDGSSSGCPLYRLAGDLSWE